MNKYDSPKKSIFSHNTESFFHKVHKIDKTILTIKNYNNIERNASSNKNNHNYKIKKLRINPRFINIISKKGTSFLKSPKNISIKKRTDIFNSKDGNCSLGNFSLNNPSSESTNNTKFIFPNLKQNKKDKFFSENSKDLYIKRTKLQKTERNFYDYVFNEKKRSIIPKKISLKSNNENIENNLKNSTNYKFIVRPENCGYLIVRCFKHRKNWTEIKNDYDNQNFHFKWQQNNKNIFFTTLSQNCGHKQMVNHFEFHNLLTNKANLFYNMMKYAEILDENVFKYIPFTILFEYHNDNYFKKIEKYEYLFNNIQKFVVKYDDINKKKLRNIIGRLYSSFFPFDNHLGSRTAINIPETHYYVNENNSNDEEKKANTINNEKTKKINNNFWLIKAPNLNRGMCIKILNDFNLIKKYITSYNKGIERGYDDKSIIKNKLRAISQQKLSDSERDKEKDKNDENNLYQSSTIVVQKYIENPLLYFGRKFDIRIWVLLTHDLKVYVFNEGHLKCCSVKYNLDSFNNYSHLTNYSFQKYSDNFQKYEYGNEVSFDDLQYSIDSNCKEKVDFKKEIFPKIQNIIKFCFLSVKSKINEMNRQYTFEIFGFDFMIDCNFEPFLIEINTNPGLEESSPLIKMLIPRMLDDALRLTVDKEFDTIYNFDGIELNSKDKTCEYIYQSPFPVNGYLNSENMFRLICDLNMNEKYKRKTFRKINYSTNHTKNNFCL